MAQSKKTTPQVDATDKNANLDNGQVDAVPAVDSTKDTNKVLIAKMKAVGLDSKGLYTEWNNGAVDTDGNNGAVDMIDFMVKKNKLTAEDKTAILTMFDAMAKANAPKIKQAKPIPDGLAEDLAQAFYNRQQVLAMYEAAKKAVDVLWCEPRDVSKNELDAACKACTDAGFAVNRKTGTIAKSGTSSTNGEHGNSGSVKLQYGTTITVGAIDGKGGTSYNGWKDLAKNLVTSVYKGDTNTNYVQNTSILDELVKLGLTVDVYVKPTLKDKPKAEALVEWEKSKAKEALDAHPSITVHVS